LDRLCTDKLGRALALRLLQPEDGPLFADFYASLSDRDAYYFYPHPLDDEHAYKLAARAEQRGHITLLATGEAQGGDVLAGYAYITEHGDGGPWWFGICVRPEYQEARVGTALLGRLLELAREHGVRRIFLHVHKDNPRGQRLYRRYGFEIVGESVNEQQNVPQYHMELALQ